MRVIQIEYLTLRVSPDLFGDLCDLLTHCKTVEVKHSSDYSKRGISESRPTKFESFDLSIWEEEETSDEA